VPAPAPSFEDAVARVRTALAARPARTLEVPGFRRAGVLVPILDRSPGPTLLFTRRTDTLPHHKGEISFPALLRPRPTFLGSLHAPSACRKLT